MEQSLVSETVKCACEKCGAKYRLPIEYQGRSARCKKCGEKFKIPAEKSVEDSVLDWLTEAADAEEAVDQPRIRSVADSAGPGVASGSSSNANKPIIRRKGE
jgi:PHP family Zn ribbon phosphoesterase